MASRRFVVTIRRMCEIDSEGRTVYPIHDADPIEFPNLNTRQRNRLMKVVQDSVEFDADFVEYVPYPAR